MPEVMMQPKQRALLHAIEHSKAVVIGFGGGRGAGKSSGMDRVLLHLMYEQGDCIACVMMRNADQVLRYHIEAIHRDYPWLDKSLKRSFPAKLSIKRSELDFSYAENYDDVERRFRSANYRYIFIDQAEQFTERELREIRKANRSKGKQRSKFILLFNMRGSGISTLRKWFYERKYNKDEDPDDYEFIKVNPWDNVEFVRPALESDGYTVADYYRWTEEQRKDYAATRGEYTRQLATDDEVIRKADWEGDWDSLEGAYFAHSFDLESVRITGAKVWQIHKGWSTHWMAQDWGEVHFCVTYWAYRQALSPSDAKKYLDWDLVKPINVTVIYREMIVTDMEAAAVSQNIIDSTPESERSLIKSYFLSPEDVTEKTNCIGAQQSKRLHQSGMPGPQKADNDRKGGYTLMSTLFKATKGQGWGIDKQGKRFQYDDAVLISSECAELLNSIPMLMRDPKDIDNVIKTDLGQAKIEQDCCDAARCLLKSMLAPKRKTAEDSYQERMSTVSAEERMMLAFKHDQKAKRQTKHVLPPSWKGNMNR